MDEHHAGLVIIFTRITPPTSAAVLPVKCVRKSHVAPLQLAHGHASLTPTAAGHPRALRTVHASGVRVKVRAFDGDAVPASRDTSVKIQ